LILNLLARPGQLKTTPKTSALMRGKLDGFSIDRLFRFLNALGRNVELPAVGREGDVGIFRGTTVHGGSLNHPDWAGQPRVLVPLDLCGEYNTVDNSHRLNNIGTR